MNYEEKLDRLYPKLSRDRRCAVCGAKAENQHHIISRSNLLLRYDVNNLLSLCYKCHEKLHREGLWHHGLDLVDEPRRDYLLRMKNVVFQDYLLEFGLTREDFYKMKAKELKEENRNPLTGRFEQKHGMKNTRLYRVWCSMKERCNNPQSYLD